MEPILSLHDMRYITACNNFLALDTANIDDLQYVIDKQLYALADLVELDGKYITACEAFLSTYPPIDWSSINANMFALVLIRKCKSEHFDPACVKLLQMVLESGYKPPVSYIYELLYEIVWSGSNEAILALELLYKYDSACYDRCWFVLQTILDLDKSGLCARTALGDGTFLIHAESIFGLNDFTMKVPIYAKAVNAFHDYRLLMSGRYQSEGITGISTDVESYALLNQIYQSVDPVMTIGMHGTNLDPAFVLCIEFLRVADKYGTKAHERLGNLCFVENLLRCIRSNQWK